MKPHNVLLIEPGLSGHRAVYLENISAYFLSRGDNLVIGTTGSNLSTQLIYDRCPSSRACIGVIGADDHSGKSVISKHIPFASQINYGLMFRRIYMECCATRFTPTIIFIPYLDNAVFSFLMMPWLFRGTPVSGILMRCSFHFSELGITPRKRRTEVVKEWFLTLLLRKDFMRPVFSIDPGLACYMKENHPSLALKIVYLPDPVLPIPALIPRYLAKAQLDLKLSSHCMLVYGAIDKRKGIEYLYKSLGSLSGRSVTFLLAGEQADNIKDLIVDFQRRCSLSGLQVKVINSRLSDQDEHLIFSASDSCWLGYKNHKYMSGVLLKAAQYKIPVLCVDGSVAASFVRRFGLGAIFSEGDADSLMFALNNMIQGAHPYRLQTAFVEDHFWSNSLRHIEKIL